jgi:peroxin-11B
MSSLAAQVIFHPVVSQSLKLGSTTLGRDKTYRAVQYLARFLAWYLVSGGHKLEAARWNALKSHLGTARKLMRLGKPMEHLQAALRAMEASGSPGEQITTIGRQLGYFGYLMYDALVWANAVKFISLKPDTAQKVAKTSNRFWLAGILFSIAQTLLKSGRLANEAKKLSVSRTWKEKNLGEEADLEVKSRAAEINRAATHYQFIIDALDLWIPASSLGLVNFNDGILGIFGFITSVMALRKQWEAANMKQ